MNIAYFKNGFLIDVSPRNPEISLYDDREIAYRADLIVSDGRSYNLYDPETIHAIPVPAFKSSWDATSELSYIMKIRCGLVDDANLVPAFVDKTLELMRASSMLWRRRDYLQVIRNYYRLDLVEAGEQYEAAFRSNNPGLFSAACDDSHEAEHQSTKAYFIEKNRKYREYALLKAALPDLTPATAKGYFQIKARNTEKYQILIRKASDLGLSITP